MSGQLHVVLDRYKFELLASAVMRVSAVEPGGRRRRRRLASVPVARVTRETRELCTVGSGSGALRCSLVDILAVISLAREWSLTIVAGLLHGVWALRSPTSRRRSRRLWSF